jgi:hypothetical protein
MANTIDFKQALLDPSSVFKTPNDVLACNLSKQQKIKILKRWGYDERELGVAEEENMIGTRPNLLHEVLEALNSLGASVDLEHSPPTKQGGED